MGDLLNEDVHNHAHMTMASRRKCASLCNGRVGCRGFESNGKECQTLAGSPSTPLVGSKPQGHAWTSCLKDHKKHGHLKDHKKHGHPTATTQGCGAFGCCDGTALLKRDREGSNCPFPTRTREETTRMPRKAFRTRPPRMPETTRPPRTAIPTREDFPTRGRPITVPQRTRDDFPTTLPPRGRHDFPTTLPRRTRPITRDHFLRTRDYFQRTTTTAPSDGGLDAWIREGVGLLKGSIFDDDGGTVVVHGRKLRGGQSDS